MMPGFDGGDIKRFLSEDVATKGIPTVFVSALIKKQEQKSMKTLAGGDIIIAKPYTANELSEAINTLLGEP